MEPNGPVRDHLVPFVHSQSYKQIRVHLDPNIHHLAGYPLGPPQGPLVVPGPHFKNHGCKQYKLVVLKTFKFHVLFLTLTVYQTSQPGDFHLREVSRT